MRGCWLMEIWCSVEFPCSWFFLALFLCACFLWCLLEGYLGGIQSTLNKQEWFGWWRMNGMGAPTLLLLFGWLSYVAYSFLLYSGRVVQLSLDRTVCSIFLECGVWFSICVARILRMWQMMPLTTPTASGERGFSVNVLKHELFSCGSTSSYRQRSSNASLKKKSPRQRSVAVENTTLTCNVRRSSRRSAETGGQFRWYCRGINSV